MQGTRPSHPLLQFGTFEADLEQGELRRNGRKVKIQDLPFQFLAALLERPGDIVSREELAQRLWSGALMDFDSGLNTAVRKLRDALDDDAGAPRYVETLPRRGYRFIAPVQVREVHVALTAAALQAEAPAPEAPAPETPAALQAGAPRPAPPRRRRYLAIAGALVVAVLFALYRWSLPVRPLVSQVIQLTQTGSVEIADGVVTDGARLYFTERAGGRWSLAQVPLHGGVPQPIAAGEPLAAPDVLDISPDRSNLLVANNPDPSPEEDLWVVPTSGAAAGRLGDIKAHAATWSRDGHQIAFARASALYLADSDGTHVRKLADTPGAVESMRWSPPPEPQVLRFSMVGKYPHTLELWEAGADGTGLHRLLRNWNAGEGPPERDDVGGTWMAGGKLYLFLARRPRNTSICMLPEGRGWRGGRPVQVYSTTLEVTQLAGLPDGKRIFFGAGKERRELVRYDKRHGQFLPFLPGIAGRWVSFSRDGQWVAYTTVPQEALWRCRADGSARLQLTPPDLGAFQPRWSPDGTRLVFSGARFGQPSSVYTVSSGGGPLETISTGSFDESDASWSPDGNSLVFARCVDVGPCRHVGIYVTDWKTRQARLLAGSEGMVRPAWSPDSRYIAATGNGGAEVRLLDLQTAQWKLLAAGAGLGVPYWSRDSQYVYYQEVMGSRDQPICRVQIHTGKIEKMMSSSQIPQANLTGYTMTGMGPGDEPIATVLRSNSDIYALDLDMP